MDSKKIALLSAVTAAIISLVINFGFRDQVAVDNDSQTHFDLYENIKEAGVIRAAYAVGAPLLSIDPNTGDKSGIFYDIVNSAAKRLRLEVNWIEEVGYGEMIQGLNSKRYDIIGSGVWINSDRAVGADFTIPLYYDAVFAYSRVGDTRFRKDISKLNSSKYIISTMDGELGTSIAMKDFSEAKTLSVPQFADFTQMILNVISNKADIVFLAAAPARSYQAANPDKIESVNPNQPLRIFPNAIMLPQGQYRFKQAFNYALIEMLNSGEINSILSRYEEAPDSFLRVSAPFER